MTGLVPMRTRWFELNERFLAKALVNENELIVDLFGSFKRSFQSRSLDKITLLCEHLHLLSY